MKTLFQSTQLGGMTLKNRLVRSATFESEGSAQGEMTDRLGGIYFALADGGVGAIITGMMGVDPRSRIKPSMLKAYGDSFTGLLAPVAGAVHERDCRLIVQLAHCGVKATYIEDGGQPVGPSAMDTGANAAARAMTADEIAELVRAFADAALRCKAAGADGVQLHGAHGYLLSQFLSPHFNHRDDAYGGDIQGRARALLEVYDAVRAAVGGDFPVWVKLNSTDLLEDGLSQEDFLWVCRALDQRGIDAIEVSGGAGLNGKSSPSRRVPDAESEGAFAPAALAAGAEVKASVISVGSYRTPERMEDWLNRGGIDALSLSRPLICEPGLPNRWLSGDTSPARCISCSRCFRPKDGFGCQQDFS